MGEKSASRIMLTLLLTSMLTLAWNFQPVKSSTHAVYDVGSYKDFTTIDEMILEWNYPLDISSGHDIAFGAAVDSQHSIIVVGYDTNQTSGYFEWRVIKFDKDGDEMWNKSFDPNPNQHDVAYAVAVDSDDNITVVGYDRNTTNQDFQWRMMKFNSSGDVRRVYTTNPNTGNGSDRAYDVAVDSQDNIIVVGMDKEPGDYQWRVIKFDKYLDSIWEKTFNVSDGDDQAYGVAVDSCDNIIVIGRDSNTSDKLGYTEWSIMKLNSTGDSIWNYTKDWSTGYDQAWGVAVDSQDNIIVVGEDRNTTNNDSQWSIMKLKLNGDVLWNISVNPSGSADVARDVAVDSDDNIIVVGFDREPGNYQWRIMKIDKDKSLLWENTTDISSGNDIAWDIATDTNDIIVVGGDREPGNFQWRIMKFAYSRAREIQRLIETIRTWSLPKGTDNSLTTKLNRAIRVLIRGNEDGAVGKLGAFIRQVQAMCSKKLREEQASYLVEEAQRIIDLIKI